MEGDAINTFLGIIMVIMFTFIIILAILTFIEEMGDTIKQKLFTRQKKKSDSDTYYSCSIGSLYKKDINFYAVLDDVIEAKIESPEIQIKLSTGSYMYKAIEENPFYTIELNNYPHFRNKAPAKTRCMDEYVLRISERDLNKIELGEYAIIPAKVINLTTGEEITYS